MSEYTETLLIAAPEGYIEEANHLMCLLGGGKDIKTFAGPHWRSGAYRYAVANMKVTPAFIAALTGDLPGDPSVLAPGYKREQAEVAHSMIGVERGIHFATDADPQVQLADWGLKRISNQKV